MSAPHELSSHRDDGVSPLVRLLAIEESGVWPTDLPIYQDNLLQLAAALEARDEQARLAMYSWLQEELWGLFRCRDLAEREARNDALIDVAMGSETPEALRKAAGKVTAKKRPNLLSFMQAKVIWRSTDILESRIRRHERRVMSVGGDPRDLVPGACARPHVHVDRHLTIVALLAKCPLTAVEMQVLEGLANEQSIADIARRTGRSRQQIYRQMKRIRGWISGSPSESAR